MIYFAMKNYTDSSAPDANGSNAVTETRPIFMQKPFGDKLKIAFMPLKSIVLTGVMIKLKISFTADQLMLHCLQARYKSDS